MLIHIVPFLFPIFSVLMFLTFVCSLSPPPQRAVHIHLRGLAGRVVHAAAGPPTCQRALQGAVLYVACCSPSRAGSLTCPAPVTRHPTQVDLLPMYGPLPFHLDFFTEMADLQPLMRYLEGPDALPDEADIDAAFEHADAMAGDYGDDEDGDDVVGERKQQQPPPPPRAPPTAAGASMLQRKHRKMTSSLCEVLSDFGLISFLPMNVDDGATVGRVLASVDKANGYSFAAAALHHQRQQQQQRAPDSHHFKGPQSSSGSSGGTEEFDANPMAPMFNLASQDLESTYARSLEILEKYER